MLPPKWVSDPDVSSFIRDGRLLKCGDIPKL